MVTPVAKAAAEAAWPDGKDEVHGACGSRRTAGISASGRVLDVRPLPMMLAVALATARLGGLGRAGAFSAPALCGGWRPPRPPPRDGGAGAGPRGLPGGRPWPAG